MVFVKAGGYLNNYQIIKSQIKVSRCYVLVLFFDDLPKERNFSETFSSHDQKFNTIMREIIGKVVSKILKLELNISSNIFLRNFSVTLATF